MKAVKGGGGGKGNIWELFIRILVYFVQDETPKLYTAVVYCDKKHGGGLDRKYVVAVVHRDDAMLW